MSANDLVRVFIATTDGPVEIEYLGEEQGTMSSVFIKNAMDFEVKTSDDYGSFVSKIINRYYKDTAYVLEIGRSIEGKSWELAVFIAHALLAAGRLAEKDADASMIVLATGRVAPRGLLVNRIEELSTKLEKLLQHIENNTTFHEAVRSPGHHLIVVWPKADHESAGNFIDRIRATGAEIIEAGNTYDVLQRLELPKPKLQSQPAKLANWLHDIESWIVGCGIILVMLIVIFSPDAPPFLKEPAKIIIIVTIGWMLPKLFAAWQIFVSRPRSKPKKERIVKDKPLRDRTEAKEAIVPISTSTESPVASPPLFSDKDVVITSSEVIIRGKSYSIADIAKVEIDEDTVWPTFVAGLCLIGAYYLLSQYPNMLVHLNSWGIHAVDVFNSWHIPAYRLAFLATGGFFYWARQKPVWLLFNLPTQRLRVLERDRDYLKKLKAQIDDVRRTSSAAPAVVS